MNDGEPLEVLTDNVSEAIMKNIRRRMTPQPVKIRADVELTCFSYDGILHIQVTFCNLRPSHAIAAWSTRLQSLFETLWGAKWSLSYFVFLCQNYLVLRS